MTGSPKRITRSSRIGWVRLDGMKINPRAQREFDKRWANELAGEFDPDKMAFIHVNQRDGWFYVMDGQHTRWAAMQFLGSDQQVQCHIYEGLSEQEEAELYLSLNRKKQQNALSKFFVAITAERSVESDVDRIARSLGLTIGSNANLGEIACVKVLADAYSKHGPGPLSASLRTIRDAYSVDGFKRGIIQGVALVVDRHGTRIDFDQLADKLTRAGILALKQRAAALRAGTGAPEAQCYACAVIEFYNRGKGANLDPWWKFQAVGA
ncbi:DUF6551 family protein [Rhodococcus jostii]|uniref:DUF6551 family protein n=1 Tax=Rhodococcus jostii TaxID=132919 RepID=UPI003637BC47